MPHAISVQSVAPQDVVRSTLLDGTVFAAPVPETASRPISAGGAVLGGASGDGSGARLASAVGVAPGGASGEGNGVMVLSSDDGVGNGTGVAGTAGDGDQEGDVLKS